jgi:formylglycine-generating enzyme required for sulfatase activity
VLLVIDQLEELLVEGNAEAERFLAFLEGVLRRELSGLVVLATLRTDFLAALESRWPGLTELVDTSTPEAIPPQRFGELISGPSARADLRLQPGLAERLVAESGGRDALPLLAFTLEKLWRKRQERGAAVVEPNGARWDLTLADLETLGGVAGVVGTQAALCWDQFTSDVADSEALQQAFVHHLVRLNEEGLATKQPARWGDLPALSRPLLKRFVEARLLVSGGGDSLDQVEIAHEALLSVWEPLVGWIKEGRQELEQRRRVARLCGDLALSQTPKTRLASLQSLLALAETNAWAVAQAAVTLEEVLVQSERDSLEWSLAIQVLAMVGDEMSVKVLIAFLEQRQLLEPLDPIHAASLLNALCQAAAGLQNIYRRRPPTSEETARWLLLPSATVSDDGRAMRTELVRIRLWATPRLENPGAWFEPLGNGLALTMVRMPPGNFLMGSSADELDRKDNECPQHLVTLESFLISQTLITQAQWRQVMNTNPSQFKDKKTDRDQRPVERVSWNDAMAFCTELSDRSGRKYNLPGEAQWEYACRAGTTLAFNFGNTVTSVLGNVRGNNINLESSSVLYRFQTSPVAHYPSNRWGLHDMHGNVEEWCLDYWNPRYQEVTVDESSWVSPLMEDGDENELHRVLRGGSWLNLFPWDCRSASRNHNHPDYAEFHVGFRVVCLC